MIWLERLEKADDSVKSLAGGILTVSEQEQVQDSGMVLNIGHLYPTLMSVAADRGNLFSIEKRCKWRGIRTEV